MKKKEGKAGVIVLLLIVIVVLAIALYLALTDRINLKNNNNIDNNITQNKENKEPENKKEFTNSDLLDLYEEKLDGQDRYALLDIDDNGKVDLITYKEDMASDKVIANYTFYTCIDNNVVEIGKVAGKIDNNVLYKMKDNTLLVVYGYMGYEIKTSYKIVEDKLIKQDSEEREVESGENYAVGDSIIPFDFVTDKIQFENYR